MRRSSAMNFFKSFFIDGVLRARIGGPDPDA